MQINEIRIQHHVYSEGYVHFYITFYGKNKKRRVISLHNIERLLDDMIFKGFKEVNLFKNELIANLQVFIVDYERKI
jgi:hypothetical protein